MPQRFKTSIRLLFALLFTLSAFAPSVAGAEAVMRCAGSPATALPCVQMALPAPDLTAKAAASALMPCCRAGHCAAGKASEHAVSLSAPPCLVTLRSTPGGPALFAAGRGVFPQAVLLPAASLPALPPSLLTVICAPLPLSVLSPPLSPAIHGLRAPPLA